jgi:hypothetical protein
MENYDDVGFVHCGYGVCVTAYLKGSSDGMYDEI